MSDVCDDCGLPFKHPDPEQRCWGSDAIAPRCMTMTINRLRRELAEVESYRRGLEQTRLLEGLSLPPHIVQEIARLRSELGDAQARCLVREDELRRNETELASVRAQVALTEAERAIVDSAMARYEHRNSVAAFANWTRAEEQKANDLGDALDDSTEELLALRAKVAPNA